MSECFAWNDNSKGCSATLNKCDGKNRLCAFYKTRKEQEEGQKKAFQRLAKVNPALLKTYHPAVNPEEFGVTRIIDNGCFEMIDMRTVIRMIEALDMSFLEFEKRAGLTDRQIYKLKHRMDFNGIAKCRPKTAARICIALGEDVRIK